MTAHSKRKRRQLHFENVAFLDRLICKTLHMVGDGQLVADYRDQRSRAIRGYYLGNRLLARRDATWKRAQALVERDCPHDSAYAAAHEDLAEAEHACIAHGIK